MGFFKKLFKKESKEAPKHESQVPASPKKTEASPKEVKPTNDVKPRKYHVSYNRDPQSEHHKMWRVRKEQSDKTIKFFKTQKEAIDYAESLAEHAGTSVVVHKMDGTIRKQNYR